MLIIPAIDLRNGHCVRLTQGRKNSAVVYDSDPIEVASRFENEGARLLHVVDLDGVFLESKQRNREVLRGIVRAVKIPVQFGGGLRRIQDVQEVLSLGVARVVIGTVAAEAIGDLKEMLQLFGAASIAVGIDARQGKVLTHGWETQQKTSALDLARRVVATGIERIVYTDVHRDGMLTGVNIEQTCLIAEVSGVKITASGGISSLDDIRNLDAVSKCGIDSVIIGKALYEGRFTFAEAQRAVVSG